MKQPTLLPWHQALWNKLQTARREQRMPHALLLSGVSGMGKLQFARRLIHALLCEQPSAEGAVCAQCKPCHLLQADTHPDFLQVMPEAQGKTIKVDQIRALLAFTSLTANYGAHHVILLHPAENMNLNAANSLLKLLEEPPSDTLLILLSHQPQRLLPTIRSRCQQVDFNRPDPHLSRAWLVEQLAEQMAGREFNIDLLLSLQARAPLAALQMAQQMPQRQQAFKAWQTLLDKRQEPLSVAEEWLTLGHVQVLEWLISWTMDLIRAQQSADAEMLQNQDMQAALLALSQRFQTRQLFALLEEQMQLRQLFLQGSSVKPQSLLEDLSLSWLEKSRHQR